MKNGASSQIQMQKIQDARAVGEFKSDSENGKKAVDDQPSILEGHPMTESNQRSSVHSMKGNLKSQIERIKLKSHHSKTYNQLASPNGGKLITIANNEEEDDAKNRLNTDEPINAGKAGFQNDGRRQTVTDLLHKQENDEGEKGGFEDGKLTKALFSQFLQIEKSCATLAMIGLAIGLIVYDLEFHENNTNNIAITLCWIITLTTIFLILLTIMRYNTQIQWYKSRKVISPQDNLYTTGDWFYMLIEIIFIGINPTPWTVGMRVEFTNPLDPSGQNVYYHVNEILILLMILRVFFIVRAILMSTYWFSNRTQRVCFMYACQSNYLFVIKCIMKTQPYILIVSAMIMSIFFFGAAIRICQSPLNRGSEIPKFESYANSMWNIIVTMTTVGYGDYFPSSGLGRFIIFIVCIWGVFIVSMMVITLINTLDTSPLEQKAIAVLERLQLKENMRQTSAHIMTLLGQFYILSNLKVRDRKKELKLVLKLRKQLAEFKVLSRTYRSIGDDNISEEMGRQFDFMRDDFQNLFEKQQLLLEASVEMMEHLQVDDNQLQVFKHSFMQKSILKFSQNVEEKQNNIIQEQENIEPMQQLQQDEDNNLLRNGGENRQNTYNIQDIDKYQRLHIEPLNDYTNYISPQESNQNLATPQFMLQIK